MGIFVERLLSASAPKNGRSGFLFWSPSEALPDVVF
jgi:hypothetical protein